LSVCVQYGLDVQAIYSSMHQFYNIDFLNGQMELFGENY